MPESKFPKYLKRLAMGKAASRPQKPAPQEQEEVEVLEPCCQGRVHIAYRGVSDDRLYISHDRAFAEIKFFRPNGLRIFCADCRRRMV
ncbi:MAG: hypothetical protein JSS83_01125 [Cyanobacteria bacterium SZAS LIN-3]|nr:hypothetical protein [Cyanobacteria bacterium SZAS LIN-3]